MEELAAIALPVGDDGVVIGVDQQGQPVVLGVNRPVPFDVVLVGGLWTAEVIALRTVSTGARVPGWRWRRAVRRCGPRRRRPPAVASGG
jgi:hypothetical protein